MVLGVVGNGRVSLYNRSTCSWVLLERAEEEKGNDAGINNTGVGDTVRDGGRSTVEWGVCVAADGMRGVYGDRLGVFGGGNESGLGGEPAGPEGDCIGGRIVDGTDELEDVGGEEG